MRWCAAILKVNQASWLRYATQSRHVHSDAAAILSIATDCPKHKFSKMDAIYVAKKLVGDQKWPFLERIYSNSGIENRYTIFNPDYLKYLVEKGSKTKPENLTEEDCFLLQKDLNIPFDQKNEIFMHFAVPVAVDMASRALKESGVDPADVGKVFVHSSTGFMVPGIDCEVIKHLGLKNNVESTFIPLMGCGAAMTGLFLAKDFVVSNQKKKALVVCVELNSLLLGPAYSDAHLVAQALFGDGMAAAVVGAVTDETTLPAGSMKLVDQQSILCDNREETSVVTVCSRGLLGTLSKSVPKVIQSHVKSYVETLLSANNITQNDIDFWGIHPGGVPVVKAIQRGLDLTNEDLSDTWEILRNYGNMGSPTVLFVLKKLMEKHKALVADGQKGLTRGFSIAVTPGMSLDGFYLEMA